MIALLLVTCFYIAHLCARGAGGGVHYRATADGDQGQHVQDRTLKPLSCAALQTSWLYIYAHAHVAYAHAAHAAHAHAAHAHAPRRS